ncbi:hypothetical protein Sru01_47460 [Sphaerisporangium rufum]|uniref:GH26 domain-containing protein n=1 Tax=Sphaerisporangium rufum TaxID=1381558 RepID=A0A919R4Y8_9ACTN|nr:DNRLRE domain-containing protein [Sphaerisporangium rufum]GII79764.1 hypothetical protein Sru01_47460 [Sphaerisporangium rufum]
MPAALAAALSATVLSTTVLSTAALPAAAAAAPSPTATPKARASSTGTQAGTTRAAAAPVSVTAAADTYLVTERPDTAYGKEAKITAANWSSPWHSQALLRFAVPATPAGMKIASATLELTFAKVTQQPSSVELRSVASTTWPEATTTYAGRPATGSVIATAKVTAGATSLSFDVPDGRLKPSAAVSFALTDPTASSAAVFHSREQGSAGPRLAITYAAATTAGGTLCGASFQPESGETRQQALAREDAKFGGLDSARVFFSGLPESWPLKVDYGKRPLVVSFKGDADDHVAGKYDATMRKWFADAPRDRDIYWVYYHEPEQEIRDGMFTAAQYRKAWQHLAKLAEEADNPRLHATQVLMQWSLEAGSKRNWRDYYPGDGVLDVLAWDVYNHPDTAAKGIYRTPADILDKVVTANKSVGLPMGVAELGSPLAAGDADGTKRAQWVRAMNAYLAGHGSKWNMWFDLNWPDGDYRLRDQPGIAAWKEFCAAS